MIRKAILILCVLGAIGTGVLWVWSYSDFRPRRSGLTRRLDWGPGHLVLRSWIPIAAETSLSITTNGGSLISYPKDFQSWGILGIRFSAKQFHPTGVPPSRARLGFRLSPKQFRQSAVPPPRPARHAYALQLPFWFLTGAFAAYPVVHLVGGWRRRRHRLRHNLCLGCGYPLKGLPSLKCPECGREFEEIGVAS